MFVRGPSIIFVLRETWKILEPFVIQENIHFYGKNHFINTLRILNREKNPAPENQITSGKCMIKAYF